MQGRIARRRLVREVGDALEAGAVVLIAGAGCGKTTVLEQVAAESRWPVAWIGCAASDRVAGTLLMRIVEAISRAAPGAADALGERLLAAPEQIDVPGATAELIAELGGLLVEPLVLVVDEAEQLDGAAGSERLLGALIRAELPVLRLALASRRPLELRVARARAAGRVAELGAAELAFDAEECAALLRERGGHEPSTEQVEEAMQVTEGWALGIALAAGMLSRDGASGGGLAELGAAPDLRSYLTEELLDSLEPEMREAVTESSVAHLVTPEIRGALGLPDNFAAQIERAGVLVRRLGEDDSFTYHPLLQRTLHDRLAAERGEEERRRLHAAVAPAVAASGDRVGAIEHWLEAQRWEEAVAAIEAEALVLARISPELVEQWLLLLPEQQRRAPTIRALQGQLEALSGQHAKAIPTLREAIVGFRDRPNPAADWFARALLVDALFATGDIDELDAVLAGWNEPAASAAGGLEVATAMSAAFVFSAYARFDRADSLLGASHEHPAYETYAPMKAFSLFCRDLPAGRLDDVRAAVEGSVRALSESDPLNLHHQALAALAMALAEAGEAEAALATWARIRDNVRGGAAPLLEDAAQGWTVLLHAQAGRLAKAEAELARYRQIEQGPRAFIAGVAPAAVASLRGDSEETERFAELALEIVGKGGPFLRYWTAVELVAPLAQVGRVERADAVLAGALTLVDEHYPGAGGRFARARLLALRAWLRHLEGEQAAADAELAAAWKEAGDSRPWLLRREWERLEALLWGALERGALDPEPIVAGIGAAFPAGAELVPLLEHPLEAVRAAAILPAVRSGDPRALTLLEQLEGNGELATAVARAIRALPLNLPPLRFELLGELAVRRGAWRIGEGDWGRPVDAHLLRFLLVHLGRPVPEETIFEALWPNLSAASARRSLHVAVSRVRRLLDLPGAVSSLIESGAHSYRLALGERDVLDADEFVAAATAASAERGSGRRALLEHARSLWGGEPLAEERHSDWATPFRERLLDTYAGLLTALVEDYERGGELAAVRAAAAELVELDPLNEGGHRALIRAYARAGRRGEALRQYLECRRTLVEQLGIEPAAETSRLQARVLAGETI